MTAAEEELRTQRKGGNDSNGARRSLKTSLDCPLPPELAAALRPALAAVHRRCRLGRTEGRRTCRCRRCWPKCPSCHCTRSTTHCSHCRLSRTRDKSHCGTAWRPQPEDQRRVACTAHRRRRSWNVQECERVHRR